MRSQAVSGKVPQVASHDYVRSACDRRGQDMAVVVGIRQVKLVCKRPVARHDGVGKVFVHHCSCPVQHAGVDVGPVGQKTACPFRMDVGAPKRRVEIAVGET